MSYQTMEGISLSEYGRDEPTLAMKGVYFFDDDQNEIIYLDPADIDMLTHYFSDDLRDLLQMPTRVETARYLSNLSSKHHEAVCNVLREMEWPDTDIYLILHHFEELEAFMRKELSDLGRSEAVIKKLEKIADEKMIFPSKLRRPGDSRFAELIQMKKFLVDEATRRRKIMVEDFREDMPIELLQSHEEESVQSLRRMPAIHALHAGWGRRGRPVDPR